MLSLPVKSTQVTCWILLMFIMFISKLVLASPGPMARDVDSLALCMQALLCDHMFTLDPTVPPIPFNVEVCPPFIFAMFALNIKIQMSLV